MSASEIVTLQIGHYSNYVGSHWWNCQESSFIYDPKVAAKYPKEVNHDVLYREGRTLKGEVTYTPRLVLFDLNNSLGSVKREGILYDVSAEEDIRWQGDVTLHQAQAAEKNPFLQDLEREDDEESENVDTNPKKRKEDNDDEILSEKNGDEKSQVLQNTPGKDPSHQFYQLEDKVDVWSDYLRTMLHPKSIHLIKEHQHNNPEQPFDVFGLGQQVLSTRESLDTMEDRVRFFTEECDQLQGFHILLDTHNAFGGFASPILTYLADEYSNKPRFSFSLTPACPPDQTARERSCRIINSALSLQSCMNLNSLHVPLSLASTLWKSVGTPLSMPHLQYKANLDYHTSAILATALDTLTLPFRRQDNPVKIGDITSPFNSYGRKVAALNANVPLPIPHHSSLTDYLLNLENNNPWTSLTPHVQCVSTPTFQSCVVRGLPTNSVICNPVTAKSSNPLASCSSVDDVLRLYLTETYHGAANAGCVMRDAVKLDTSFPHIFTPNVSQRGYLSDVARPPFCGVESIPLMTSLQSGKDIFGFVDSLAHSASLMNMSKHQHFLEAGLDPDDFTETLQDLNSLGQCYVT